MKIIWICIEFRVFRYQGMERLCIMGHLNPSLRRPVKKEIINIIRNIDRHSVFRFAVKSLLALVYTGWFRFPVLIVVDYFPVFNL